MFQRSFDPWIVNIIIKNLIQNFQNFIFPQEIEREIKVKIFLIEKKKQNFQNFIYLIYKREKKQNKIYFFES